MRVSGEAEANEFARQLLIPPRQAVGRNAIGTALLEGLRLIERNEFEGWRKVIDFSGDSVNNYSGPSIAEARARVLDAGIVINALAILRPNDPGRAHGGLEAAYENRIIGGTGAFVVTAENRASFADAVRRKLVLEISGLRPFDQFAKNNGQDRGRH